MHIKYKTIIRISLKRQYEKICSMRIFHYVAMFLFMRKDTSCVVCIVIKINLCIQKQ